MKRKRLLIILGVLTLVFVISGGTLAYITWTSTSNTAITFTVANNFSCAVDGGGDISSGDVMLVPAHCTNSNYAIKRELTVMPSTSGDIWMNINLKVNSIDSGLSGTENFRYVLSSTEISDSTNCYSGNNIVSQDTFEGATTDTELPLLDNKKYSSTTTETYYLYY